VAVWRTWPSGHALPGRTARLFVAVALAIVVQQGANAGDTFSLRATARDFAHYTPTYLANGHWSMASSILGTDATPAQMAGLMDYTPGDVSRPAAIPSWNEIDYFDGVEWLNAGAPDRGSHLGYRQTLNMRDGVLSTQFRWRGRSHVTDVSVTSFVSQRDSHMAAVSLQVTPRFSGTIHLRFTLRSATAPRRLPLATMSAAQFGAVSASMNDPDLSAGGNRDAIWYRGDAGMTTMGGDAGDRTLWMAGRAVGGRSWRLSAAIEAPDTLADVHTALVQSDSAEILEVDAVVRRGRPYRFTKFVVASAEGWDGGPTSDTQPADAAVHARDEGLASLQAASVAAWHALWRSDVRVGGNAGLQRTIHSDLFYLLENSAPDTSWPAAACGFSANYFGHVFWDNDFWVFPPLLLLHPERARSLIAFRQRTLSQAVDRARAHGFAGAMYPWESDPWSGEDVTPTFAAENADREVHVNGAVSLAQWQYYLAEGDLSWLREHGYPVIKAVADFWTSRVTRSGGTARFGVLDVTSPEEDYTHVDNEIYTNAVARRSLLAAVAAARALGEPPDPRWSAVAEGLPVPATLADGRYHDFDPSTPHDRKDSWMATSVPMLSIPSLDFTTDPHTLAGLFEHSLEAITPIRQRANQMVLVCSASRQRTRGGKATFPICWAAAGCTKILF
jgi:hypothetical protein